MTRDAARWLTAAMALPGMLALVGILLTANRTPLASWEEAWYASAAHSMATGGDGVAAVSPDDQWMPVFARVHGPVFYWLASGSIRLFGWSPWSYRLPCVLGVLLFALSGAGLMRTTGAPRSLAAAAFSILMLTPEAGNVATNGRTDSLAVGFALLGLVGLLRGVDGARFADAWQPLGVCGALWALATMTTPRIGPFLLCLAVASPLLLRRRSLGPLAGRLAFLVAVAVVILTGLSLTVGRTPVEWLRYVSLLSSSGMDLTPAAGGGTSWDLRFAPQFVLVLGLGTALIVVSAAGGAFIGERGSLLAYACAAAALNVVLTLAFTSLAGIRTVYYGVPMLAVALPAAARLERGAVRRIAAMLLLVLVSAECAVRAVKYGELAISWKRRDTSQLAGFLRGHVLPGAVIYSDEGYYYYAVQAAGAHFRFPPSAYGLWTKAKEIAIAGDGRVVNQSSSNDPRYLLLPDAITTKSAEAPTCRTLVATFQPETSADAWIERLPPIAEFANLHGYRTAYLYRLWRPPCPE